MTVNGDFRITEIVNGHSWLNFGRKSTIFVSKKIAVNQVNATKTVILKLSEP